MMKDQNQEEPMYWKGASQGSQHIVQGKAEGGTTSLVYGFQTEGRDIYAMGNPLFAFQFITLSLLGG
ncbi:hypothetical protein N8198_02780 [Gammaproteobacteria bacterium]|nr:hypothetical protein [Gammaproteobacteria bacterium]